jgi:hypothetical protein
VNTVSGNYQAWGFSMRAGSGVIFNNVNKLAGGENANIGLCEEDSGYPADYQIGRGINQSLDPVYVWNNTRMSLELNECDAPEQPGMVQLNRDVYSSEKPNYAPYTFPHPLAIGGQVQQTTTAQATTGSVTSGIVHNQPTTATQPVSTTQPQYENTSLTWRANTNVLFRDSGSSQVSSAVSSCHCCVYCCVVLVLNVLFILI